ncbi:hypothetical protein LINPERPRIM_LOCUS13015 [Linum perenne]
MSNSSNKYFIATKAKLANSREAALFLRRMEFPLPFYSLLVLPTSLLLLLDFIYLAI